MKNKKPTKTLDKTAAKKDNTIKVYEREKISITLNIAQPTWSPKQQEYIDIVRNKDTKVTLIKGPAGSSKTFINLWLALELLNIGRIKQIILVRSVVESSSTQIGLLPGTIDEKFGPYAMPFLDKLQQLLPPDQIAFLYKDQRIIHLPVNFLRGREFNSSFIFVDEAQNLTVEELQTLVTRYGRYSKLVVGGDTDQSDLESVRKMKSGFRVFYDWYNKDEARALGIQSFKFGVEDIKREPIIAYFVEQYPQMRAQLETGDYRPGKR